MSHISSSRSCAPVTLSAGIMSPPILSVVALIAATGTRLERLPAYAPDLNPKEECISKVKAELRRVGADTKRKLANALKRAYAKITTTDIRGWFKYCGYAVP